MIYIILNYLEKVTFNCLVNFIFDLISSLKLLYDIVIYLKQSLFNIILRLEQSYV